jgi:hypothetical protein
MRFVAGTGYAASALTHCILGRATSPAKGDVASRIRATVRTDPTSG